VSHGSIRNETNLIGRPAQDRAMLEKMRSKLVAAKPAESAPRLVPPRPAAPRLRRIRRSWIYMLTGAALLGGLNILFHSQKDQILGLIGIDRPTRIAAPMAAWPERDKALFWAYAAYDRDRLRRRYHLGPQDVVDPADARHHLAWLLQQGLPEDVKKEIEALRPAAPLAGAGKAP
jgi:hypothetical protein